MGVLAGLSLSQALAGEGSDQHVIDVVDLPISTPSLIAVASTAAHQRPRSCVTIYIYIYICGRRKESPYKGAGDRHAVPQQN